MHRLAAIIVVVCMSMPAFPAAPQSGQTPAPAEKPTRTAAQIVRAVESRYQAAQTLQAVFLERYSQNGKVLRVESGTVYFSRPGRMRWEYERPEEKLFLADGKQVWFYVPADRTVTRAKVKESADWHTPLALLAGKTKRGTFARLCGSVEVVDGVAGASTLRCSPKSKELPFRELLLETDSFYRITRILIREPGGVETDFGFADWRENLPLAEVLFHFQPPKGVAIVEEGSIAPRGSSPSNQ